MLMAQKKLSNKAVLIGFVVIALIFWWMYSNLQGLGTAQKQPETRVYNVKVVPLEQAQ